MNLQRKLLINEKNIELIIIIFILLTIFKILLRDIFIFYSFVYLRYIFSLFLIPLFYFHSLNESTTQKLFIKIRGINKRNYVFTDILLVLGYSFFINISMVVISLIEAPLHEILNTTILLHLFATILIYMFFMLIYYLVRFFLKENLSHLIVIIIGFLMSIFENIGSFMMPTVVFSLQDFNAQLCINSIAMMGILNLIMLILVGGLIKKGVWLHE